VPFLSREVHFPSPRYPRLIHDKKNEKVRLLLDKGDVTKEIEEMLELEERQEMERLLYVALTRARHTLVLAADHKLFAKRNGQVHSSSQMKWFRADERETNWATMLSTSTAAIACEKTAAHQKEAAQARRDKIDQQSLPEMVDAKAGAKNASEFVQTISPSRLPAERIVETGDWSENLKTPAAFSPALRYGVWWHEFMQQLPWDLGGESWKRVFERNKTTSPEAARSKREWELLEKLLATDLDFRQRLVEDIVHKEMPILWRIDETRCLEGIVDLALFQGDAKKVFILDWKTNRIAPDKIDSLRARYRPQMAAYWKAIHDMTNRSTMAAIYSTFTGRLIVYDQDELTKEWERLRQLSPNEFKTKLQPPEA
jgi:ATP-dependent exoDNAse (exonuclease V) beta subunit